MLVKLLCYIVKNLIKTFLLFARKHCLINLDSGRLDSGRYQKTITLKVFLFYLINLSHLF